MDDAEGLCNRLSRDQSRAGAAGAGRTIRRRLRTPGRPAPAHKLRRYTAQMRRRPRAAVGPDPDLVTQQPQQAAGADASAPASSRWSAREWTVERETSGADAFRDW